MLLALLTSPGQAEGVLIQGQLLRRVPQVVHAFTNREGPDGAPRDLRLGVAEAAWSSVVAELGLPGAGVARVHQVHGREVLEAEGPGLLGEADALFTRTPGLVLAIRVADCVPVLLLGEGVVAAAHAGWRGLAAGVLPATVRAMGGAHSAVVGPCIGVQAYEVGEEVVAGLEGSGVSPERFVRRDLGPRPHVDLREVARLQLEAAGVGAVEILPHCTFTDPSLTSYRREGADSLRLAGLIALRPA